MSDRLGQQRPTVEHGWAKCVDSAPSEERIHVVSDSVVGVERWQHHKAIRLVDKRPLHRFSGSARHTSHLASKLFGSCASIDCTATRRDITMIHSCTSQTINARRLGVVAVIGRVVGLDHRPGSEWHHSSLRRAG